MKKRMFSVLTVFCVLLLIPVLGGADIAAKDENLALFLKPSWSISDTTTTSIRTLTSRVPQYKKTTDTESHGGRKFYQYEDYAGSGILYTVKPEATGLPRGYKHKGTVVVAEIGWGKQTPVTAQDVWDIWEQIPDDYKYKKGGVTQIQLLSDELRGTCYVLDNKYGLRDLRVLVYGARLTGSADQDRTLIEEQMIEALKGQGPTTRRR